MPPIPDLFWSVFTLMAGPVMGSVIGLISLRLPAERPVAWSRSACDGCGRRLGPVDLIPILGWLIARGRCRTCGAAIPRRYLALELGCLAVAVWAVIHHGGGPMVLTTALLGWALVLIAVVDGEHFWLPDVFTLPLLALGLGVTALQAPDQLMTRAVGAVAGFVSLALVAWLYARTRGREGLGGGDPRLFAAAGAWVGWMGLPSVLVFACAAAFSLIAARLILRKPVSGTDRLPFGVFLAVGLWMVWLYGPLGGAAPSRMTDTALPLAATPSPTSAASIRATPGAAPFATRSLAYLRRHL